MFLCWRYVSQFFFDLICKYLLCFLVGGTSDVICTAMMSVWTSLNPQLKFVVFWSNRQTIHASVTQALVYIHLKTSYYCILTSRKYTCMFKAGRSMDRIKCRVPVFCNWPECPTCVHANFTSFKIE